MAIDILKLDESNLLPTLGNGDWLIALPNNQPAVTIPALWRQQLSKEAALRFVRWVKASVSIEVKHDLDPPWDHSGQVYRYQADPIMLLTRYETLQEWLDGAYAGNSTPTYLSGMGLLWETYGDDISRDIDDSVFELLKTHLQTALGYDEDDDDDPIWMEILDEVTWVQSGITRAILLTIGLMSIKEVWATFQAEAEIQIAEEKRQAEERAIRFQAMRQQAQEFWRDHFADLDGMRIEIPQFKTLDLANRLLNLLADTDPNIVEAIAEIGLPGDFSNSVALKIQFIARDALQ